jgi:hypothetical protein
MRRSMTTVGAMAMALALTLGACGGADDDGTTEDAATSTTSGADASEAGVTKEAMGFVQALAKEPARALEQAVPGSPAASFANYFVHGDEAAAAGGATPVSGRVEPGDGEVQLCRPGCGTLRDFRVDGGKVASFRFQDTPIADLLRVASTPAQVVGPLRVRLLESYKSPVRQALTIHGEIEALQPIDLSSVQVDHIAADGTVAILAGVSGKLTLAGGEKTIVGLSFAGVGFGGKLRLSGAATGEIPLP